MLEENQVDTDSLKTVTSGQMVEVERIKDSDYVLSHTKDMSFFYGGLVNEEGLEKVQVMINGDGVRFNTDNLLFEYVTV